MQYTNTIQQLPASATIAVALSGGADSLYTMLSLHNAGINVIGVHGLFAQCLPHFQTTEAVASSHHIQNDLRRICQERNIPFYVLDCTEQFAHNVIQPFVASYAQGKTPNPCALCNASIKFGAFMEKALALGATHLATGHYVRLLQQDDTPVLLQGADPAKDQSYFLSLVPISQLQHACFPLGDMEKTTILATLASWNISPSQKGESQEVCFVPNDEYREFLPDMAKQYGLSLSGPGPMVLEDGHTIGTHKGLWQYTEGQRKGLGVGWKEPLHVLAKNAANNTLELGPRAHMEIAGCVCHSVNILLPQTQWGETVWVKTRYREKPKQATVSMHTTPSGTEMHIHFTQPETVVAAGQIAAIYIPYNNETEKDGRPVLRLVAGGIISESIAITA